jgi:hypothetical protein
MATMATDELSQAVEDGVQGLRQVQYITTNYAGLQGLKMVPLGLWLWLWAVGEAGWWPWRNDCNPLLNLLTLPMALALWLIVGAYYTRAFGRVRPTSHRMGRTLFTGAMVLVVSFPWLLISGYADAALQPPVSVLGLTAAGLLALWCSTGRLHRQYLVAAALIAVVSLLPLLGIISRDQLFGGVLCATLGTVLVVGGVLDHLRLARSLKPLPKESHDGDV